MADPITVQGDACFMSPLCAVGAPVKFTSGCAGCKYHVTGDLPARRKNPCEWDPERNEPAQSLPKGEFQGCPNEATISLGANGKWHLCDSCAALPNFKRFRVRERLNHDTVGRSS